MNERITELMIDAGKTIPGEKHIDADFCNKFAELIVRECICQCDDENSQKYIMSHFRSLLPIGFTEKDWS